MRKNIKIDFFFAVVSKGFNLRYSIRELNYFAEGWDMEAENIIAKY